MEKCFCDRCKKCMDEVPVKSNRILKIEIPGMMKYEYEMRKFLCKECANDIMNIIDYECDRYKLNSIVEVSKEATTNEEKMS